MFDLNQITVGLAFLAGLASFLSPCVFALVPAYVGYLGGQSAAAVQGQTARRWNTFLHGLAFVAGFSFVFIGLGLAASALGQFLFNVKDILARVGGVVVVILGIHMTGLIRIPFLMQDVRAHGAPDKKGSYLSSALMGIVFSAGWSPCVGPVLGTILTLSFNGDSLMWGAVLLTAYSAGLAVPFLISALGIGWVVHIIRRHGKMLHFIEIGTGIVLILVGAALALGMLSYAASLGSFFNLGL